jgi:ubiquinone/menaquinone biosynthesis C-methylase UbiE
MSDERHDPTTAEVRAFWEQNPLCAFEAPASPGERAFFDWHDQVRTMEVEAFALGCYEFDRHAGERVLDIGCGIGWLCARFAHGGARTFGVDLTWRGVTLTRERLSQQGLSARLSQADAERLPIASASIDFVTSAGVLHHTPSIEAALAEVQRVLRPGGRGMISLYHSSWLFQPWAWPCARLLLRHLIGRLPGREQFKKVTNPADLVRIYDGDTNPLGRAYTRQDVTRLFGAFAIERCERHYFPVRFLRGSRLLPRWLHRLLDSCCGTMLYVTIRKEPTR